MNESDILRLIPPARGYRAAVTGNPGDMRKQMEGDNKQRRKRARQAREDEGVTPSEAQVTLGASKEREHKPHKANETERQRAAERGKQRTEVDDGPSRR